MDRQMELAQLLQGRSNLGLEEILDWGGAVLDEVYGGDESVWRDPRSVSLRELSFAADVSVSTLYRYVAVAALWRRCGSPVLEHVGVSHLRQLLPLPADAQKSLLKRAEEGRWTVAELRRVASLHRRRPDAEGRGRRPRTQSHLEALEQLKNWKQGEGWLEDGLQNAHLLCEEEARELLASIRSARAELSEKNSWRERRRG